MEVPQKAKNMARHQWLMPVTQATKVAEDQEGLGLKPPLGK
jgi:hypothetical protein